MKTAVSIPDEVFEGAEHLARRTRRSRSRLYSDALREYLTRHSPDKITQAMNHTTLRSAMKKIHSCSRRLADVWSKLSGDLARRDLVGRFA